MRVIDTIAGARTALQKRTGSIALVPTMGNLHEGHIALMEQAHHYGQTVVASIFVNRLQFRPGEDFEKYPRTFAADGEKLETAGVDFLFAPHETEMYPTPQGCYIEPPPELTHLLEGEYRPGHFRGVATVVMKLFQIIQPQIALFGKKDWQQLAVIREMVATLNLPIEIIAGETVRAPDGLALSSRNGYLSSAERAEAPRLHQVLMALSHAYRSAPTNRATLESDALAELSHHGWMPDYVVIRDKIRLQSPPNRPEEGIVLAAAKLGTTRLIDNLEI
ncbi:MAG: pantoate--beta-alanine ligase [Rhodocyclaceae bacterium]|nr:pantoate--beta-alanine ligase [Rhodocyclaceae bacterium]